jgi:OmpA family protein
LAGRGFWACARPTRSKVPLPPWIERLLARSRGERPIPDVAASDRRADDRAACLAVQGHASITGLAALNERLSLARAQRVRAQLVAERPPLRDRVSTEGFGSRQPIVGSGTDDAADALDRRVEFKLLPAGSRVPPPSSGRPERGEQRNRGRTLFAVKPRQLTGTHRGVALWMRQIALPTSSATRTPP